MSYDQKKRRETSDHKLLKNRGQMSSDWGRWKDLFKGYEIFSSHFQKKLYLKNI